VAAEKAREASRIETRYGLAPAAPEILLDGPTLRRLLQREGSPLTRASG